MGVALVLADCEPSIRGGGGRDWKVTFAVRRTNKRINTLLDRRQIRTQTRQHAVSLSYPSGSGLGGVRLFGTLVGGTCT